MYILRLRIAESGLNRYVLVNKNVSIGVIRVSPRFLLLPVGFPCVSYHGTLTVMVKNIMAIMANKQKWTVHEFTAANQTHFILFLYLI